MSELHFRITVVPQNRLSQKDEIISAVKLSVVNCGLDIVSIKFFQAAKSEEEDYPEIEELILQIHAKVGNFYPKQKIEQYELFCSKWTVQSCNLPCSSYITLYADDSFIRSRQSRTEISWQSLCFGVLPHDGIFHRYASLNKVNSDDTVTFYHNSRNVVIKHGNFEIIFSYDNIRNVFVNNHELAIEIFFDLFNPPIINRLKTCRRRYEEYTLKYRNKNLKESRKTAEIDEDILGRANVLRLSFFEMNSELRKIIANIHFLCSKKSIHYSYISSIEKQKPSDPVLWYMEFSCSYLMTAIFKRNFVLVAQSSGIWNYLSRFVTFSRKNPKSLEKALIDVLSALDSGKILNFWHAIENRFEYHVAKKNKVDFKEYIVPSKCCLTRRITITPTRQLLWPPEVLFGNRVVRNFDSEFSIRVSFRDDNMQRLSFVAPHADGDFLESCIKKPMSSGVSIGDRHYEFLAWSNSQIRDHGVYMYAKNSKGTTSADIRTWMGDFSHIHNVPKYMSRMGQCFSQTEVTVSVPLNPQSVRTVPDIEGGYNRVNGKKYCFSDGIGRISSELAAKVHNSLGHDKLCSAFQIRYGGYKGMLVIDPTLKDVQIEFRNSMKKFDCPKIGSPKLEIARTSAPIPLQLNRPFITLLNDLGVAHRVLLRLQEDMLKTITDMLFDEEKAAECLKAKTPAAAYDFEKLSRSGIFLTTEPYFRNILLALHRHQIEYLKSKANVSIDPNYGRNMLGVLDETGILNYGQVFIQYTNDISCGQTARETTVLEREVMVTKNPCHYPGDVRKFRAVNIPQLHHIVDCIVFPQKGPRPHPDEMAGSDLDGDEYAVIWLPELIFHRANELPAHFPDMKSLDVPNINTDDMINFLQAYIKSDQVGSISHAHLALADNLGIGHNLCLAVAKKISIAVDFAKTGRVVPLAREERPKEYPDFMEKNYRREYKSRKALGKMYRICRDYETENEEAATMHQVIKVDQDLVYPGWEKYKEEAIKARNKYNSILASFLRNYGIEHESEVISGAFTKLHCRFQERKDRAEIQKVIVICLNKLQTIMLAEFLEEFAKSGDVAALEKAIFQKASAWYVVTYSDPEARFLSFAWIVSKYLADIKIRRNLGEIPPFSPAIMNLDEKIIECERNNLLPPYAKTVVWSEYGILCEPQVIERALRVLVLWAQDEDIIAVSEQSRGFLYLDTFIRLFLHVVELCRYVVGKRHPIPPPDGKLSSYSPGKLCVEFLKFCSSLRFYNMKDIHQVLPFYVYKYSKLAKRAVVSYRSFALSGMFRNLYFDRKVNEDLIEMKSFSVDSNIFSDSLISESSLQKAEEALLKYSNVSEVHLADYRQTKRVWVSALGTERAIKELRGIFRKKPEFLRNFFSTGVMPEIEIVWFAPPTAAKRVNDANIENTTKAKRAKV